LGFGRASSGRYVRGVRRRGRNPDETASVSLLPPWDFEAAGVLLLNRAAHRKLLPLCAPIVMALRALIIVPTGSGLDGMHVTVAGHP